MPDAIQADIYVRISKIKHRGKRKTLGVERQEPPCRAFCEQQGWTVRKVWVDNGLSAHEGKRREQFEAMLAEHRDGKAQAIVSWQADRLLRTVEDASAIVAMAKRYGTIVANVGGTIDLATAAGRKKFYDLAVAAQYESELRSERLRLKHDELAQAGAWWGGKWRPFGWQQESFKRHDPEDDDCTDRDDDRCPLGYRLVLDRGEAGEVAKQVAAVLERGATPSGIAADWNRRGITRPGGGLWQAREVRKLLTSPSISGRRRWKGKLHAAQWDEIITPKRFERLQLALANPAPNARRGSGPLPRAYLLSGGLAVCGCEGCERPLTPHRSKGRRTYRCQSSMGGCGKVARAADAIEDYLRDLVLAAFDDDVMGPELLRQLDARADADGGRMRALLSEREGLEQKLIGLENAYYDNLLDRDQFARGQARVKARMAAVKEQLDAAVPVRLPVEIPDSLEARHRAWKEWVMDERRRVVAFALTRVVVKPVGRGYRFDGDRDLVLEWRI
jgi:DNA invertase Pin-like site-specific DNA recombinase